MKVISGFLSLVVTASALGQNVTDLQALASNSGSMVAAVKKDVQILESANYIMNHPADSTDQIRTDAMGAVLFWMMSTPDYTFFIDETIVPVMKKDAEILAIYMVSMTQVVLENPTLADDTDAIKLQAFTRLLTYCDEPSNKIRKSKAISQAIDAMRTGWLKEYLKIS